MFKIRLQALEIELNPSTEQIRATADAVAQPHAERVRAAVQALPALFDGAAKLFSLIEDKPREDDVSTD